MDEKRIAKIVCEMDVIEKRINNRSRKTWNNAVCKILLGK